ncbi:hypothetical protein ACQYRI_08725 [Salmonella enterica]
MSFTFNKFGPLHYFWVDGVTGYSSKTFSLSKEHKRGDIRLLVRPYEQGNPDACSEMCLMLERSQIDDVILALQKLKENMS